MGITTTAAVTKKTMGRRKIEIKKIEKKTSLQVTFAKRRRGLFRKASELSILCGAEVAILVQSPAEKIYTFAHPTVDALINRLTISPEAEGEIPMIGGWQDFRRFEDGRRKYEDAVNALEMEKMREREKEMGGGFWWEEPYEGLELHELEEFLKELENLGERVEESLKVKMAESASAATAAIGTDDQGCSGSSSTSNELALMMMEGDDVLDLSDIINMFGN